MDTERIIEDKTLWKKVERGWWTPTYTLALLVFLLKVIKFVSRTALSVTIIEMKEELSWSLTTQGVILGASFYGELISNIVGGRSAEYFGAKIVLFLSLLVTSLSGLLTPSVARYSTVIYIALRIVTGFADGVVTPAMVYLITKWASKEEKAKLTTWIFTGGMFGIFLSQTFGGWITMSYLGWSFVFYSYGIVGICLSIGWIFLVDDNMRSSEHVTIESPDSFGTFDNTNLSTPETKIVSPFPWKNVFTSKTFWSLLSITVGGNFFFVLMLVEGPSYLVDVLDFSLEYAGTIAGTSQLTACAFSLIYSWIMTYLVTKDKISVKFNRRFSMGLQCFGMDLAFIIVLFTTDTPAVAAVMFYIIAALGTCVCSGILCSYSDVSPTYAGTLIGIINSVAMVVAVLIPLLTSALISNNTMVWGWRWLIIIGIIISTISSFPYIFFYKPEVEPWDDPRWVEYQETKNKSQNQTNKNDTDHHNK